MVISKCSPASLSLPSTVPLNNNNNDSSDDNSDSNSDDDRSTTVIMMVVMMGIMIKSKALQRRPSLAHRHHSSAMAG